MEGVMMLVMMMVIVAVMMLLVGVGAVVMMVMIMEVGVVAMMVAVVVRVVTKRKPVLHIVLSDYIALLYGYSYLRLKQNHEVDRAGIVIFS